MLETFYLIFFTCEMTVKMVAYGVAFHEDAYLRDSWCQLDFLVVSLAWLPILVPGFGTRAHLFTPALSSIRACSSSLS